MLQTNYDYFDYDKIKTNFNLNMVNFANLQTNFILDLPKELNRISLLTDKISNLNIIAGNCYLYKKGNELKEIENKNIIFDKDFNSFKLKPTLAYKLEIKENLSKLITNKAIKIYDKDKTKLKNIDDLLIRNETINIKTTENNYNYTFNIRFGSIVSFNNINLRLNEETLSYPKIKEIFYVTSNKEKVVLKLLNNNSYSMNLDLYKNLSNEYLIDTETGTSDNISIVFEDNQSDLILDNISINYMEYSSEGYIILEGLKESKPILKLGIEAQGDTQYIDYSVSYNKEDWYPIDLSNIYGLEKSNKVLAFNTISNRSLKSEVDVKNIYLRLKLKAKQSSFIPQGQVNREIYTSSTLNVYNIDYDSYSVYENNNSIFYGKISKVNVFDFKDLYNNGEYLIISNSYYIKGFVQTSVSKTKESPYTYSPVEIKNKEIVKSGESLIFDSIDISTKEITATSIKKVTKNLLESLDSEYVITLKDDVVRSKYYLVQDKIQIEVNLETGFINSSLDVLYTVEKNKPIYLLDSFKNLYKELTSFVLKDTGEELIHAVSLLDTDMFNTYESISKTYPLTEISDYELGFIDNKIYSINLDREVVVDTIFKEKLYLEDFLSNTNKNHSKINSKEDYKKSIRTKSEIINQRQKQIKLINNSLIKGSVIIKEV